MSAANISAKFTLFPSFKMFYDVLSEGVNILLIFPMPICITGQKKMRRVKYKFPFKAFPTQKKVSQPLGSFQI